MSTGTELHLLRALTMLAQLLPHPLLHHNPDLNQVQQVEAMPLQLVTGEVQVNPKQLAVTVPLPEVSLVLQLEMLEVARTATKPLLVVMEVERLEPVPGVVLLLPLPLPTPTMVHQDKQVDLPLLVLDLEQHLVSDRVEHQALLQLLTEPLLQDHLEVQQVESSRQELAMEHLQVEQDLAMVPQLILQQVQATVLLMAMMIFQVMENNFFGSIPISRIV